MLSPGAKGWINKYFDLVEKEVINLTIDRPPELRKLHFMHLTLGESGMTFGYPIDLIFAKELETREWTTREKLKLLLFEAQLFVYLQIHLDEPFNKDAFLNKLYAFYHYHNASSIKKLLKMFSRPNREERIEEVLRDRTSIESNYFENKWWVNTLSNAFIYLDVILFDDYLHWHREEAIKNYSSYAKNALIALTLSAYSDGLVEKHEKKLFDVYLASANLDDESRDLVKSKFINGASLNDFSLYIPNHWLLKRFLFDLSALNIFSHQELMDKETKFLEELAVNLEVKEEEMEESFGMIENFVLKAQDKAEFLSNNSSYEKVYRSLIGRWTKVLERNKDRIAEELKESKELVSLVNKSRKKELTLKEKEAVKKQFKDIVRSIPALAIFMIPGGTLLLPIVLKVIPDLIPSAFRENELDD
ncbi:MAG: LETM1 domain-containing protein [Crocinitomicaceae bacterium]